MADYEHTARIHRTPADVYAYVADVGRLPEYMSSVRSVRPTGDGRTVDTTAVVEGQTVEGQAWLETDDSHRALRWGAAGANDYHGELSVAADTAEDDQTSTVTVTLHTTRADGPGVRAGLEGTLASIKQALEGRSVDIT